MKLTRVQCYTEIMLRNMTITVSEEAARWARRKDADENTSVSRLVGRMLEDQIRKIRNLRLGAARRLTREEAHARRG